MTAHVEPYNLVLLDPSPAELAAAVEQAVRESVLGRIGRRPWPAPLAEVAATAEGRCQLARCLNHEEWGQCYLVVAWWTDHQQRKHVRIASGWLCHREHRHWSESDKDLRPPLWHVHPERVFRVTRTGQEPTWLACCACGATGEPTSLAWMGSRCGPCHDRAEEGSPHPDEKTPALFTLRQRVHGVKFTPDGRHLAISSSMRQLRLFSMNGREERLLYGGDDADEDEEFQPLAFAHDGRFVAAGDPEEESIRVWDLHNEDEEQELVFHETAVGDPIVGLVFSLAEHLLVACTRGGLLAAWRRQEDAWERAHRSRRADVTAMAFAPDGQTLILGHQRCFISLVDVATWKRRRHFQTGGRPGEDALFVRYFPAAERLALLTACQAHCQGFDSNPTLRLRTLCQRGETSISYPVATRLIVASRCGRYLAWVIPEAERTHAGIAVYDLHSKEEIGRLQWDTEAELRDLEFSPDGHTLVTGSLSGTIKFWPWRRLLGV